MGLKVTNNAYAVLNASITSSATTIVLVAGQGARFPTLSAGDYFYATLIDTSNNLEIVKVTARSTDTLTVVRGQDSTTARAYATNDRFELRPTAALFNEKANANEYLPLAGGTLTGKITAPSADILGNMILGDSVSAEQDITFRNSNGDWQVGANTSGVSSSRLFYIYDTTASAYRLTVTADGHVRTLNQPAFHVLGTSYTQTNNGTSKIIPDTEAFDVGGHYDRAAGRFTAPVAGVYLFGFFGLSYPHLNGDVSSMQYYKNGSAFTQNAQFGGNSSNHVLCTGSVQMNLSAGDYVELFMYGANGAKAYGSQWNMWGRLCG
jgi:hypothetical protein